MAEKFGKGWFAIMVSENIDNITIIPEYILKAISHACPLFNNNILLSIAKYRLKKFITRHFDGDTTDYVKLLSELDSFINPADAIEFYKIKLPEDVLTKLIN